MSWTSEAQLAWKLFRDVLLTLTGLGLIVQQALSASPREGLVIAGLALTGIGATFHIGSLASGSFGSSASQPPQPPSGHGSPSKGDDHAGNAES